MLVTIGPDKCPRRCLSKALAPSPCELLLDLRDDFGRGLCPRAIHELREQELLQAHPGFRGPPAVRAVHVVGHTSNLDCGHACILALAALNQKFLRVARPQSIDRAG